MTLSGTFGIAVPNFTAYPEMPDIKALVEYGVKMEQMGFDSLWVWDHILLGVEPNFPIIESLTLLTAYGITSCSASSRTFRSSSL